MVQSEVSGNKTLRRKLPSTTRGLLTGSGLAWTGHCLLVLGATLTFSKLWRSLGATHATRGSSHSSGLFDRLSLHLGLIVEVNYHLGPTWIYSNFSACKTQLCFKGLKVVYKYYRNENKIRLFYIKISEFSPLFWSAWRILWHNMDIKYGLFLYS
jgi:hypothetical protein